MTNIDQLPFEFSKNQGHGGMDRHNNPEFARKSKHIIIYVLQVS